jgi:hypothetical protein
MRSLLLYHLPVLKPLYHLEAKDYKTNSNFKIDRKNLPKHSQIRFPVSNGTAKSGNPADDWIHFCVFTPRVFATLRHALGMSHESFIKVSKSKIKLLKCQI